MSASVRCILFIVALQFFTTFCEVERQHICNMRHIQKGPWRAYGTTLNSKPQVFKDCKEVYDQGSRTSGVYKISPDGILQFDVYCEQELDRGGWTVFQRRQDGSIDFYRDWAAYEEGFGKANGEFWLGNDYLNKLTSDHNQKLKIELTYNETKYADYSTFWIENEALNYRLTVAGFSGTDPPGDSFTYHNQYDFSTKDRDNQHSCAQHHKGAWWYRVCRYSNLNGIYGSTVQGEGVTWNDWKGSFVSMTGTRMMIKRKT